MFNLIDVGERTGSGLPNIFRVWKEQGLPIPSITQEFSPERTILALTLQPAGQTKKTSSGTAKASKAAPAIRKALIIDYLTEHASAGARELSSLTGASVPQIQRLLSRLVQEGIVVREGSTPEPDLPAEVLMCKKRLPAKRCSAFHRKSPFFMYRRPARPAVPPQNGFSPPSSHTVSLRKRCTEAPLPWSWPHRTAGAPSSISSSKTVLL